MADVAMEMFGNMIQSFEKLDLKGRFTNSSFCEELYIP